MVNLELLFLVFVLALLLDREEVAKSVEVFLHDETDALGVERRLGEITVVGLVVHLQGQVAVGV